MNIIITAWVKLSDSWAWPIYFICWNTHLSKRNMSARPLCAHLSLAVHTPMLVVQLQSRSRCLIPSYLETKQSLFFYTQSCYLSFSDLPTDETTEMDRQVIYECTKWKGLQRIGMAIGICHNVLSVLRICTHHGPPPRNERGSCPTFVQYICAHMMLRYLCVLPTVFTN